MDVRRFLSHKISVFLPKEKQDHVDTAAAVNSNIEHRSWSDLPTDLLLLFLDRLTFADTVRFAAVCKSWRSAASESRHFQALRLPWQVLQMPNSKSSNELQLFSPSEGRLHRLNLPASKYNFCGFSKGWLTTFHSEDGGILLQNLFTGTKLSLPRIMIRTSFHSGKRAKRTFNPHSIKKAILSRNPPSSPNLIVAILQRFYMVMCSPGGDRVWLEFYYGNFHDIVFFEGLLYCVTDAEREDGVEIAVIGFSPEPSWVTHYRLSDVEGYNINADDAVDAEEHCFVESGDELLLVVKYSGPVMLDIEDGESYEIIDIVRLDVYVLDTSMAAGWRKKTSLGDRMLILGERYGVSVVAEMFFRFGLRSDCIYFIDDHLCRNQWLEFCIADGKLRLSAAADSYFKTCPQYWFQFN